MYSSNNAQPHKLLLGKQTFESWYAKLNTLNSLCQSPTGRNQPAGLSSVAERPTTFSETELRQDQFY